MPRESRFDQDRPEDLVEGPSRRERSAKHQEKKKIRKQHQGDGFRSRRQALRDLERGSLDDDWDESDDDETSLDPGDEEETASDEEEDDDDEDPIPDDVAADLWDEDWEDDDSDDDDDKDWDPNWDEEESRWN